MLLGVSRQSVAKWESGQSTPEVDKLMKMAELFDCTLDELVSGDCTNRTVADSEILPENAPAQDLFGYDDTRRKFARNIATGVAFILLGTTGAALCETLSLGEMPCVISVIVGVIIALAFILPSALEYAAFAKAHPFIEDFYTDQQKTDARRAFAIELVAGIGLVLAGFMCAAIGDVTGNDNAGSTAFLGLLTVGVWLLVHGGIMFALSNVESYNRERADEKWERENPRIDRTCTIVMLVATIIGLLLLFGGMAARSAGASATVTNLMLGYFWVVWPIGGIACAIIVAAMKAAANR